MASKYGRRIANKILYNEVKWCKDNDNQMSEFLATLLHELVSAYAEQERFRGYSFKEDMISDAMTTICRTWHMVNLDKLDYRRTYAYYTVCINGFAPFLNREARQRNIKKELEIENASKDTSYEMVDDEQHF